MGYGDGINSWCGIIRQPKKDWWEDEDITPLLPKDCIILLGAICDNYGNPIVFLPKNRPSDLEVWISQAFTSARESEEC